MTFINWIIIIFLFLSNRCIILWPQLTQLLVVCFQLFPIGYMKSFTFAPLLLKTFKTLDSKELYLCLKQEMKRFFNKMVQRWNSANCHQRTASSARKVFEPFFFFRSKLTKWLQVILHPILYFASKNTVRTHCAGIFYILSMMINCNQCTIR